MKLLFLLFAALKSGKVLLTAGSMLVSVVAYAFVFGWRYAIGFVALIFVHEMGHFLAARRRGLDVGAPTFIPFVGAWIELKALPHDAETEAYVGIAGPLAGTLGALACFYAARVTGSQLLLALSYSGCFLNLFNLIPLAPFDGGRISAVISPRLWLVGAPLLVGLFVLRPSPLLLIMALLGLPYVRKALRGPATPEEAAYYAADPATRLSYGLAYFGLAAFLALMCHSLIGELPGTARAFG